MHPESASSPAARDGTTNSYTRVAGKLMVGLYVSVWARKGLVPYISGVQVRFLVLLLFILDSAVYRLVFLDSAVYRKRNYQTIQVDETSWQ